MKKTIQRLKYFVKGMWTESYLKLRLTSPVKLPTTEQRTISVAIPFFNNAEMAHVSLFNILSDPRISEIVVLDDCSSDENFEKLRKKVKPFAKKVKLFRRNVNWGAFANKLQAVELCSSDWVILLDYDNTLLPAYLNSLFNIEAWDERTIYCSAYAYPSFDFRQDLGGKIIDLNLAASMIESQSFNGVFFNDGNYFLNRKRFLDCAKPFWNYVVAASDVIFANYLWLSSSNTLTVLRDSRYIHRVHGESTWLNSSKESTQILQPIKKRIRDKISPYSECMKDDFAQTSKEWIKPAIILLH
jgi:glycosyltransferase involved in cell wall biosynthesis